MAHSKKSAIGVVKCRTKYCKRSAYERPNGKCEAYCTRCKSYRWKASKPFSYHFNALRNNAKRRGKAFTLTIQEYTDFALKHQLFDGNGVKRSDRTIDRINDQEGYHAGNIQVLSRAMNTRKMYVDYYRNNQHIIPEEDRAAWQAYEDRFKVDLQAEQLEPAEAEEDLPF